MLFNPLRSVIANINRLLVAYHEVKPRYAIVRISGQLVRVDVVQVEERQALIAEFFSIVKQSGVKLAEQSAAHVEFSFTVCHVISTIAGEYEHRIHVTTEEADPIAEGLLRGRVVNHDEVAMLLEALHNPIDGVRAGAEARMEALLRSESVVSSQLSEIVESRKEVFHNVEC